MLIYITIEIDRYVCLYNMYSYLYMYRYLSILLESQRDFNNILIEEVIIIIINQNIENIQKKFRKILIFDWIIYIDGVIVNKYE